MVWFFNASFLRSLLLKENPWSNSSNTSPDCLHSVDVAVLFIFSDEDSSGLRLLEQYTLPSGKEGFFFSANGIHPSSNCRQFWRDDSFPKHILSGTTGSSVGSSAFSPYQRAF